MKEKKYYFQGIIMEDRSCISCKNEMHLIPYLFIITLIIKAKIIKKNQL